MDLDEPNLNRIQCIKCSTFLSLPFLLTAESMPTKNEIRIPRYKGDNINYHAENDYNINAKVLYSFIYCLKCHEKVGYWMSQASKNQEKSINHVFFFTKCINLVKYDKSKVSKEEDKIFKQEEAFYNSQFLTEEVIKYAKEHIDNFLKNLKIFEKQRTEAKHCYDSFDRNILTLKDLFVKILKNGKPNTFKLNIDFTKNEISEARLRNKMRAKTYERYSNNLNEEDEKSNGKKINNNEEIVEENGQNGINNIEANNGNDNNINGNGLNNNNGGDNINVDEMSNNLESDIYMDEKQRQNNKEPSKNVKKNNKKNKKKK